MSVLLPVKIKICQLPVKNLQFAEKSDKYARAFLLPSLTQQMFAKRDAKEAANHDKEGIMREKRSFAQETCIRSMGKAMQQTGMLYPGCRVGVAVSGGVDSFVMLKCLRLRQGIVPFPFEIFAIHLNPGFDPANHEPLVTWLAQNGIPGHVEITDYGLQGHSEANQRNSACFRCAWLRRRRLFELCREYHLTHLAIGHNAEDLVSTFFLNLCRNGRVEGMSMSEPFFGGSLQVIRPLMLVEKRTIRAAARKWELPVWSNPCPSAGHTSRSSIEETLHTLYGVTDNARRCIFNGLTRWQLDKDRIRAQEDAKIGPEQAN